MPTASYLMYYEKRRCTIVAYSHVVTQIGNTPVVSTHHSLKSLAGEGHPVHEIKPILMVSNVSI